MNTIKLFNKTFLALLIPLFLFTCSFAFAKSFRINSFEQDSSKGVQWRCKRCGGFNYSETADWEGNYYCAKCGACKGDG